jgi:colanic acid/amylovoran biosynthesis protein
MKILINWIGPWADKGEAAMLISIRNSILTEFPDTKIYAEASSFEIENSDIINYEKYNINLIPSFLQKNGSKGKNTRFFEFTNMIRIYIWSTIFRYTNKNIKFLIRNEPNTIGQYLEADWVIVCGGQNFVDKNWGTVKVLFTILFCKKIDKPIMIWANSIGPFKNFWIRQMVKKILPFVKIITVREENSLKFINDLNLSVPTFLTPDAAFHISSISKERSADLLSKYIEISDKNMFVGLTTLQDFNTKSGNLNEVRDNYIKVLAKTIDYLIENHEGVVFVFPHNTRIKRNRNDFALAKQVEILVKNKSKLILIEEEYSPDELKGLYGLMDLYIGTRCHSCIFSSSMLVPTIAINYDSRGYKTQGIMKMVGLEKYVCDINTISFEDFQVKIEEILNNREQVVKNLIKNMNEIDQMKQKNISLAKKHMGSK